MDSRERCCWGSIVSGERLLSQTINGLLSRGHNFLLLALCWQGLKNCCETKETREEGRSRDRQRERERERERGSFKRERDLSQSSFGRKDQILC